MNRVHKQDTMYIFCPYSEEIVTEAKHQDIHGSTLKVRLLPAGEFASHKAHASE